MSTEPTTPDANPDPSQYIRTYAKDVAALSGKAPSKKARAVPSIPVETHAKKSLFSKSEKQTWADHRADTHSRTVDLTDIDSGSASIDDATSEDVTLASLAPEAEALELPRIETGDIVASTPPAAIPVPAPKPEPTDAERSAILARLKAKAASESVLSAPIPEPLPIPVPPPTPIPVPVPIPSVPIPAPRSAPEEKPAPFHSFSTDFADRIDTQHASKFTVLAAEKDSNKKPARAQHSGIPLLPILAGFILILLGAGGVFATYHYMYKAAPVVTVPAAPALLVPDSQAVISDQKGSLLEAIATQADEPLPANNIEILTLPASTNSDPSVPSNPLTALKVSAPDILTRNIDPISIIGIVHAGAQTRAFFVLRVTSYERTFAGMLAWEDTMPTNLSLLYPLYPAKKVTVPAPPTASSTASTTSPAIVSYEPSSSTGTFVDEEVSNHDARGLKDTNGGTIMIYGYADKQTLVIARDETAFSLIVSRLKASSQ